MKTKPPSPPLIPPLWTKAYTTFVFLNFFNFMGFYMLLSTLSLYLKGNSCSDTEIGIIIGSFTISSILSRILSIPLAKSFGAVRVVRTGLIVFAIGTLFFFLIKAIPSYLAARILEGAGFGVTSTLLISMVAQIIPPKRMAEGLGFMGLGTTVSMAIGPLFGLFVANEFGFECMFSIMTMFTMISAAVTLMLPKINLFTSHAIQKPKGFHGLHLDLRPLPPSSLAFFYGIAICSVTAYMAVFTANKHLPSAAIFFVTSTIGTMISRIFAGKLYDRHGHFVVIPPAAILLGSAFLLIVHSPLDRSHFIFFLSSIFYGLGIGALFPAIQTLTLTSMPPEKRTSAAVVFYVFYDLGNGLGTVILGFLAGLFGDYAYTYIASSISLAILFLTYAFFFLWPKRRQAFEARAKLP
ncbi:MAG: MFS transporter [Deltaproteobacteria bacterium]|jgi:MFS family permease|nr:MFS transporter [Deltaproteobacteria bacterium]